MIKQKSKTMQLQNHWLQLVVTYKKRFFIENLYNQPFILKRIYFSVFKTNTVLQIL